MNTKDDVIDLEKKKEEKAKNQEIVFDVNDRNVPLKTLENLEKVLKYHGYKLMYNELKRCIVTRPETHKSFDRFIANIDTACQKKGLYLSMEKLYFLTSCIASDNAYNPIRNYLIHAHKQFKKRNEPIQEVDKLLKSITYAKHYTDEDRIFCENMLLKWLITGAKLGMNDGFFNADFIILFQGEQGMGKTRWCRSLMPEDRMNEFFKDGIQLDVSNKDDVMQCTSYWLVELGETGGTMKKSDRNALKAFLTSPWDEFRAPYAKSLEKHPRRTFFAGTVNDSSFLRDETGNRRFVVLEVEKLNADHGIDPTILWGEIMEMIEMGVTSYMTEPEIKQNNTRNLDFMVKGDEQQLLEEYLPFSQPEEEWGYITCAKLCDYMMETHQKFLKPRATGRALASMGIKQEYMRIGGSKGRYYKLPYLKGYSMPF